MAEQFPATAPLNAMGTFTPWVSEWLITWAKAALVGGRTEDGRAEVTVLVCYCFFSSRSSTQAWHTRLKLLTHALCLSVSRAASPCVGISADAIPSTFCPSRLPSESWEHVFFVPNYWTPLTHSSLPGWGEFTAPFLLPQHQPCKCSACRWRLCVLVWKGCLCIILLQCKCFRPQCSEVIKYMLDFKSMNDLWICVFVLRTKRLK